MAKELLEVDVMDENHIWIGNKQFISIDRFFELRNSEAKEAEFIHKKMAQVVDENSALKALLCEKGKLTHSKCALLRAEDCYCDLDAFYGNVAKVLGISVTGKTRFDCRKICVTKSVQDVLWLYYREKRHRTDEQIEAILLAFGPKACINEDMIQSYRAEIRDGFVTTEEYRMI